MAESVSNPAALPASLIQEASAGTGKTFALSGRYLQLLLAGVDPSTVLATTFTRAAAGEILDRIVKRLSGAAKDDREAKALGGLLGFSLTREQALGQLCRLMHQVHELAVGTIDSFFNRLAKACSLELRLPPGWELADEDQMAAGVDRAVQQVLAEGGTADLLNLLSHTDGDRQISASLHRLVGELYDLFQQAPAEAWEVVGAAAAVRPDAGMLEETAAELESLELSGRLVSAVGKDIADLRAGRILGLVDRTLLNSVVTGNLTYSGSPLPEQLVELYRRLGRMVEAELTGFNAERNRSAHRLLERFAARFAEWQRELGRVGFGDLTHLLAGLMETAPAGLDFRMDAGVRHLLLDEFQDTSPSQWAVLQPLVRSAVLSGGGTVFCVGDPKQSIYGWRGGVAEMFEVVRQDLPGRIHDAEPLIESRRSAQAVIDCVNRVFGNLGRFSGGDPCGVEAVAGWGRGFVEHRTVHRQMSGCARMIVASVAADEGPKPDRDAKKEAIDLEAVRAVQRALEGGVGTTGVLMRTHDDAARLIFRLRQAGIACSEEGGNPLTDSAAVNVLLAAFHLADHPADSVSGFLVSHSPLGRVLGIQPPGGGNDCGFQADCHRVAGQLRSRILERGYGDTCFWLAGPLFAAGTERERARLELLVNEATAFDLRKPGRASQFAAWIRNRRIGDPSAARVRVMTIHRAKGLEFDAVVAPMYGFRSGWSTAHPAVVYSRNPRTRQVDQVLRYVRKELRAFLPPSSQQVFSQYEESQVRESLCLLYVLMTRARRDLTLIVGSAAKATMAGPEGVLLATLDDPNRAAGDRLRFLAGDPEWMRELDAAGGQPDSGTAMRGSTGSSGDGRGGGTSAGMPLRKVVSGRGIGWQKPSQQFVRGTVPGSSILRMDQLGRSVRREAAGGMTARQRGSALHAMLQTVVWLGQPLDRGDLEAIAVRGGAGKAEAQDLVASFFRMLGQPGLNSLLNRNAFLDHVRETLLAPDQTLLEPIALEVWNEAPLLVELEGRMIDGAVDRMVLVREGRRLLAVELIEYKTDEIPPEAAAVRARIYAPQMELYRAGTACLFGLPPERVTCRIAMVVPDAVIRL